MVNLLVGSLAGAWFGAGWATRLKSETLYKIIAALLVAIALVLIVGHNATAGEPLLTGGAQLVAGVVAGFVIGLVASLLGVAGGELLIPTLVLLFGADSWPDRCRSPSACRQCSLASRDTAVIRAFWYWDATKCS